MLTAALAVLCALLVLVLLVQRPAIWPVLVVLAVLWFALFGVFRYRCLLYTSPSPRDLSTSRMPSSA